MDDDVATVGFDPPIEGGVVAGSDGSDDGQRVLEWSLLEAAAHGEPLHAVRAWRLAEVAPDAGAPFGIVPSLAECQATVAAALHRDVERARAACGATAVAVQLHAVHTPAEVALLAASHRARVVVVGHRGRGRLQLVLGSVTEHLLGHAGCPVVVIGLHHGRP